jgi:hypothetical protein
MEWADCTGVILEVRARTKVEIDWNCSDQRDRRPHPKLFLE